MTIFAYGQTSTGKTYTMQGDIQNNPGIIPLTLEEIFNQINSDKDIIDSQISVSFIEIYNESINDLLNNTKTNLELRETQNKEVVVNNLTEIKIKSQQEALNLLIKGNESRIVASTKLNEKSSRSHCIFRLNLEITKNIKKNNFDDEEEISKIILKSHINLIDLAGSENSSKTGCVGQRLKEGSNINKSLLALSNVINKLSQNYGSNNINSSNFFINYRDSKLTRLLQNSLGGNSKTVIICTITDDGEHYTETMNTLHFGNKAKNIKTVVKVNEIKNQNYQQMILENEKLKKKLKQLEKELTTQKKLNLSEIINKDEANSNIKNRYLNLTAPQKINLNNSFSLCYTANNRDNINLINNDEINEISAYKYPNQKTYLNRTKLALNNMEKELLLLKQYLLQEQNENLDNGSQTNYYLDNQFLSSSNICKNLMNNSNYNINQNYPQNNLLFSKNIYDKNKSFTWCNVENFSISKKEYKYDTNNKIKELEKENLRLKNELSLFKNNYNNKDNLENLNLQNIGLNSDDELSLEENLNNNIYNNTNSKKNDYFLNKGRKVLFSQYSKIPFIKSLTDNIKNLNKNKYNKNKEDTQILIQLNQTIKNLNQNIISDIREKKVTKEKDNNFLQRKTNKNF
jgi:centromeric protein E